MMCTRTIATGAGITGSADYEVCHSGVTDVPAVTGAHIL